MLLGQACLGDTKFSLELDGFVIWSQVMNLELLPRDNTVHSSSSFLGCLLLCRISGWGTEKFSSNLLPSQSLRRGDEHPWIFLERALACSLTEESLTTEHLWFWFWFLILCVLKQKKPKNLDQCSSYSEIWSKNLTVTYC